VAVKCTEITLPAVNLDIVLLLEAPIYHQQLHIVSRKGPYVYVKIFIQDIHVRIRTNPILQCSHT